MKIKIERKARKGGYTIGKVYVDGKYFCDSLEDTDRGVTQLMPFVPTGGANGYWVKPDTGLYDCTIQWWEKHKCYCPMLLRVGGFTGILLHNGMTADHSEGCVLLGKNNVLGRLDGDRIYMDALAARVMACQKTGEKVTVEVV